MWNRAAGEPWQPDAPNAVDIMRYVVRVSWGCVAAFCLREGALRDLRYIG